MKLFGVEDKEDVCCLEGVSLLREVISIVSEGALESSCCLFSDRDLGEVESAIVESSIAKQNWLETQLQILL